MADVLTAEPTPAESTPAVETGNEQRFWGPELVEKLYELLDRTDLDLHDPSDELNELSRDYKDAVYTELIYLLSHLRFDNRAAQHHWREIIALRDHMRNRLESSVDLRVALVSYFLHVNRQFRNPKVIEMKLFEQTQDFAYRDELTDLHNYRLFREYLGQEVLRSRRCGTPLSLVMIDIDNFKIYNDTNGHEAGNQVLAGLADLLREFSRPGDLPARYGGEEFALILPMTPKHAARDLADLLRARIERQPFADERSQPGGRMTASMGVATYPADASDTNQLVRQADRALYAAKASGRNRVQLYGKSQRSFSRVDVRLEGSFRTLVEQAHPMTAVNLSLGGMLAQVDCDIPVGSLVDVTLKLPSGGHSIVAGSRVVHVNPLADGNYQAALRITDMDAADHDSLAAFIREREPHT